MSSCVTLAQCSHTGVYQGSDCTTSLAPRPDDAKQDPVVYGTDFGVVFVAKGLRSVSIQDGLGCLGLYHSDLEGDAHPACASPRGNFKGHFRGFGHSALLSGK